ncbi:MAG TPA: hypothetical protein DDZ80_27795 [Cyanobacteria bacterium UBA8803]|nr:hypothetical protein [Cyanobacteria bacterium UBA9273]HBL62071.1 hypothetical protein [Cyanobacteria bacterium UBA8803]
MAVDAGWEPLCEHCFRILYGLPSDVQIGLASFMMRRYLPLLEVSDSTLRWLNILLDDVGKWVEEFGKSSPRREGTFKKPGEGRFLIGLSGLLDAYYCRDDPFTLTHSVIYAAISSIEARRITIWAADDPEAVEMWNNKICPRERTDLWNVASIAVSQREWNLMREWLKKAEVGQYSDQVDIERMEYELATWRRGQFLLLGSIFSQRKRLSLEEKSQRDLEAQQKFRELGYK